VLQTDFRSVEVRHARSGDADAIAQNPFVESFNGKARDELFAREIFDSVFEARVLYDDWCDVYNRLRPHSSLGYMPPAVFAAALINPQPSLRVDR